MRALQYNEFRLDYCTMFENVFQVKKLRMGMEFVELNARHFLTTSCRFIIPLKNVSL